MIEEIFFIFSLLKTHKKKNTQVSGMHYVIIQCASTFYLEEIYMVFTGIANGDDWIMRAHSKMK